MHTHDTRVSRIASVTSFVVKFNVISITRMTLTKRSLYDGPLQFGNDILTGVFFWERSLRAKFYSLESSEMAFLDFSRNVVVEFGPITVVVVVSLTVDSLLRYGFEGWPHSLMLSVLERGDQFL